MLFIALKAKNPISIFGPGKFKTEFFAQYYIQTKYIRDEMKKLLVLVLLAASMSFALRVVGDDTYSPHYEGNIIMYGPSLFRIYNDGKTEINGFKIYYYVSTKLRKIDYTYRNKFFLEGSIGLAKDAKISYEVMPESPNWIRVIFDYPTRKIPAGGYHPTDGYYLQFEFGEIDQLIHGRYYGIIKRSPREHNLENIVVESASGKVLYGKHPTNDKRVGILAAKSGCYYGEELDIKLDTEDSKNKTAISGFSEPMGIVLDSKKNIEFRFCVLEYDELPKATFDYFVLRLDNKCPKNSYPFRRHHDCEDSNNKNAISGNVPRAWPSNITNNADMEYCFVPKDTKNGVEFPFTEKFGYYDLNFGVFANYFPSLKAQWAEIHLDDEDSNNKNSWYWYDTPSTIQTRIKNIVNGTNNTTYNAVFYSPISAARRKEAVNANNNVVVPAVATTGKQALKITALSRTNLDVELSTAGDVEVSVVNTKGAIVAKIKQGNLGAGIHSLNWNSANVPNGLYIVTVKQNGTRTAAKIFLK